MKGLQDDILEDLEDDKEFTTNLEGTDKTEICKIKGSKFHICFADVYEDAMNMIEEQDGGEINDYYQPAILKDILDQYAGIFPLWSGILLGNLTRYCKKSSCRM